MSANVFAFSLDEKKWREDWVSAFEDEVIQGVLNYKKEIPLITEKCMRYDNDTVLLQVQYGRFISAFETCRKQGGGIDECIQRVQRTKEEWRKRCQDAYKSFVLLYYTAKKRANDVRQTLKNIEKNMILPPCAGGLCDLATNQIYADMSQRIAQYFPGSQFNLMAGSGSIVLPDGVMHFQGWQFVQWDYKDQGGLIIQIFLQRVNFVAGGYNIGVNLKTGRDWEIIEFNLPFDSQTEQLLVALNRGVRLTNKEIIQLVNKYLHDTVWEVDLRETFKKLLLEDTERRFFMESLLEYYAYDTYLKKVVAEGAKQKQQLKGREQEQEQKPQPKTKKNRGTKK